MFGWHNVRWILISSITCSTIRYFFIFYFYICFSANSILVSMCMLRKTSPNLPFPRDYSSFISACERGILLKSAREIYLGGRTFTGEHILFLVSWFFIKFKVYKLFVSMFYLDKFSWLLTWDAEKLFAGKILEKEKLWFSN